MRGTALLGDLIVIISSLALTGLSLAGVLKVPPAVGFGFVGVGTVTALAWISSEAVSRVLKKYYEPSLLEEAGTGIWALLECRS